MGCKSGQQTNNPEDWSQRSFQTFLPGDPQYRPEYEGLGRIMCYSNIEYSANRQSATVEMRCRQHHSITKVQYDFNNQGWQDSKTHKVDSSFSSHLPIKVKAIDNAGKDWTITMEPLNFVWQGANVP
jgi:alpha-amylase